MRTKIPPPKPTHFRPVCQTENVLKWLKFFYLVFFYPLELSIGCGGGGGGGGGVISIRFFDHGYQSFLSSRVL